MPVIPKDALDERLTRFWYATDQKMHQPLLEWLADDRVRKGLETFCNKLILSQGQKEVHAKVIARTQSAMVNIPMKKAAAAFFSNIPEKARGNLTPPFIQAALEMLFEEAGYVVENHVLTYELFCPPLVEEEEELEEDEDSEEVEPMDVAAQIEAAAENASAELDDLEEDLDDDAAEEDDAQPETVDVGIEGAKADPISAGDCFTNGKGIVRQVTELADGKVAYAVVQGKGRVKTGSQGSTSYKAFLQWSEGRVEAPASA